MVFLTAKKESDTLSALSVATHAKKSHARRLIGRAMGRRLCDRATPPPTFIAPSLLSPLASTCPLPLSTGTVHEPTNRFRNSYVTRYGNVAPAPAQQLGMVDAAGGARSAAAEANADEVLCQILAETMREYLMIL